MQRKPSQSIKKVILILLLMTHGPLVMFVPGEESTIPTTGAQVLMTGQINGGVGDFRVDLEAFTQKINEVNLKLFGNDPEGAIIVKNTAFVQASAVFGSAEIERFDKPFASIQDAIDAITPGSLNWVIIVYPGYYIGDITLTRSMNLYCYGGVTIAGNVVLSDNSHLQFDCGSVIEGDIVDNGLSVESTICGCLTHNGEIILSGATTVLTAHGDQMFQATITDATFNCCFGTLKKNVSSFIFGAGSAEINIYGLNATFSGYALDLIRMQGAAGILNLYGCEILAGGKGVVFEGITGSMWNSKVTANLALSFDGTGTFRAFNNYIESLSSSGVVTAIGSTITVILRRNYITVANSVNVNVDAFLVDTGNSIVIEANTFIAKGTGSSVEGSNPTTIKTLVGNGSNKAVNANITETISTVFVDAAYE